MDKHDRPNSSDIFWFVKQKYIIRSLPAIALPYKQDAPLKMLVLRRGGRVSNPKNIEIESF